MTKLKIRHWDHDGLADGATFEKAWTADKAYVIQRIGTDSDTKVRLEEITPPAVEILDEIAPLANLEVNLLGPMGLDRFYVVIPPDKPFRFAGTAGAKVKCNGRILELAPGEVLPTEIAARFGIQATEYITYQRATYSHGIDAVWTAGDERTVLDFTCPVGEKHTFKRFAGVNIVNLPVALTAGTFAVRFYKEDAPLDIIDTAMGRLGVDAYEMPLPPRDALTREAFTLKDMPIELLPGENLKVKAINVSGADITPPTGTSIDVTVNLVDERVPAP